MDDEEFSDWDTEDGLADMDTADGIEETIQAVALGHHTTSTDPSQIQGYSITGKLGEGGMGVVWKALQESTSREVALKILPPHSLGSVKAQQRFAREVATAASLEHPHIARVYDSGLNRGVYYYAMQAIDGVEIHHYIAETKLKPKAIITMMIKVIEAVHFAHQKGIIHRDLKPGNVLVSGGGEPHILDFGLARTMDSDPEAIDVSRKGEMVGTPVYMSTEQAQGNVTSLDARTDVYSH